MFRGKKYQDAAKQIEKNTQYDAAEGFGLICKTASAKFDETVELHVKLGVDSIYPVTQNRKIFMQFMKPQNGNFGRNLQNVIRKNL